LSNPQADVDPGEDRVHSRPGTDEGQGQGYRVEDCRLLQQMIVIIRLPAHRCRQLRMKFLGHPLRIIDDLQPIDGCDAGRIKPTAHHERPQHKRK
jgi:hypothetical protein